MKKKILNQRVVPLLFIIICCLTSPISAEDRFELLSITYELTDDKNFSGEVTHTYEPEEKVEFKIKNISKKPFNFKKANYYAVKKDNSIYRLKFEKLDNPSFKTATFICNPQDSIIIKCFPPENLQDLKGFFITLSTGRKIYFEYEELSNWRTILRKLLETIGIRRNLDKEHPAEEGWKKGVTSSGNVYYYKEELDRKVNELLDEAEKKEPSEEKMTEILDEIDKMK